MRLVIFGRGEKRLVGRDQRDSVGIGEIEQSRLGAALRGGAVALQLDIEPVAEQLHQHCKPRHRQMALAGGDGLIERTARPAGQRDDPLGLSCEPVELDMRLFVRRRFEEGARIEPHQAAIAGFARGEQNHPRPGRCVRRAAHTVLAIAEIDRQGTADDRLDAGARHLFGEFERAEHVVGVGQRQRRLLVGLGQLGEPRNRSARPRAANRTSAHAGARNRARPSESVFLAILLPHDSAKRPWPSPPRRTQSPAIHRKEKARHHRRAKRCCASHVYGRAWLGRRMATRHHTPGRNTQRTN